MEEKELLLVTSEKSFDNPETWVTPNGDIITKIEDDKSIPLALKLQQYIFKNFGNNVIFAKNTFTDHDGPSIVKDMEIVVKKLPENIDIQILKKTEFDKLFPYGLKVNYNVFKNILTITAQKTGKDI